MRQLFDNFVGGLTAKVSDFFHLHSEVYNSNNKIENNFYGPVHFSTKQPKEIETKTKPMLPQR